MIATVSRRLVMAGASAGLTAGLAAAVPGQARAPVTARQILDRMRDNIGTVWREGGVDRIIAGMADTPVTGIATTMMATFDALKMAVASKLNLVITHEPTYWSHQDITAQLLDDPLYQTKLNWMRAHNLVVFHFHDHWHGKRPIDGINIGMARKMGWMGYMDAANSRQFNIPPTSLLDLAKAFRRKLGDRTMRVIGERDLMVSKVVASWGNCSAYPGVPYLNSEADVLVIGEAQDWDLIAYAQDLVTAGRKKGLIVLGHVLSEQWGMEYCADWLKGFVPEVPVRFVPLIEPYWGLRHPVMEIDTKI
jgi:putative NIF3 family GTP cyclohydrolase 1 type 2